jgi:putative DNA primase/helicase
MGRYASPIYYLSAPGKTRVKETAPMQNDRQIVISAAGSRWAEVWPAQTIYWSELVEKLKTPVRSTESLAEYLTLPKTKQDNLKDVGGFVAGALIGNRRHSHTVAHRDVLTLDLDNIPTEGTQDALRRVEGLGCGYCVYSTRKHYGAAPRLRVLLPLNRPVTSDEYEPLARKMGAFIGIELCDRTTFQPSRLMYWPSCCADSQYVYQYADKPFLDADGLLATYTDWHNIEEWPKAPGEQQARVRLATKQGNPLEKPGIVGAFCRIYTVEKAMETFLPGAYEPCAAMGTLTRYTFTGGSTVGGAIVYEDGNFLYSHHATDPAGGRLVNAFDLVRLHKFGELDDTAKPETPTNRLPSFTAMCEFAVADEQVAVLLNRERYEKAVEEFSAPMQQTAPEEDLNWINKLQISPSTGTPLKTIKNVRVVLENDPLLKGRIKMDLFTEYILARGPLPWSGRGEKTEDLFRWRDEDDAGLRGYIEQALGFRSKETIDDALILTAMANGIDPLVDYLKSTEWDRTPRLDTLYIDYLGAEDCEYVRTVARKAFTAAVARVMEPGCKFDTMTVICGRQGIGKTTLIEKLGMNWFSNSVRTFEGKDAAELLQGVWIVEIGELEVFKKTDIRSIKQFLSKRDDQYRAAYARKTDKHLRKCVFFGTTNDHEYLTDPTGNRRFWPIDAEAQPPTKSALTDLNEYEVRQIWAEAVIRWRCGETLFLDQRMEAEAEKRREGHTERDPLQGQIEEFLERPIPADWDRWNLERRRLFWAGGTPDIANLTQRDRVCALEIWRECLGDVRNMSKADSNRINTVLSSIPGWSRVGTIRFGGGYGVQRGYRKAIENLKILSSSSKILQNVVNIPCKHSTDL